MLLFVAIFFVLTISVCDANEFLCHFYDSNSKSLEIYCDHYRQQLPKDCVRFVPSLSASDVDRLKIEGCDPSAIGDASEKFQHIQTLDVSHSGLRSLDWSGNAFKSVTHLDASFNELTTITGSILNKFPMLKTFTASNNKLESIGDDAFVHLSDLQTIRLDNNRLLAIPPLHFRNHPQMVHIEENPQLSSFNCTAIAAMGPATVHLSWQYITSFMGDQGCGARKFRIHQNNNGTGYEGVSTVTGGGDGGGGNWDLHCNDRSFRNLHDFVAGPQAFENVNTMLELLGPSTILTKMDLSKNLVDALNATAFQRFPNLRELNLSDTGLTAFDFSWLNNSNLNQLDISLNPTLNTVENPMHLEFFENLNRLDISRNRIQNANEIVQHLPIALTHLNMSDLDLYISDANLFKPLRDLISLDVSHNDLRNVNFDSPHHLSELYGLKDFRAANCRLTDVSFIQHLNWPSLEKLDLSGNLIEANKFEPGLFDELDNLKEISLNNMGLHEIDTKMFEHMSSLTHLDIAGNKLQRIEHLDHKHFPELNVLNVHQIDCNDLEKLRLEFKGAEIIGDKCKPSHKFWIILICILAIVATSFVIIMAGLWLMPKICKEKY